MKEAPRLAWGRIGERRTGRERKGHIRLPRVPPRDVGWCRLQETGQTEVGVLGNSGVASKSGRLSRWEGVQGKERETLIFKFCHLLTAGLGASGPQFLHP